MKARTSLPVLLWDGDCGFCEMTVRALIRGANGGFQAFPYQSRNLEEFGLSVEECREAAQWVTPTFTASGADAISHALRHGPVLYRLIGSALLTPPVRPLARRVYRAVARSRKRISRGLGLAACRLPDQDRPDSSMEQS